MRTFAQILAEITGGDVVSDEASASELVLELQPGRAARWGSGAARVGHQNEAPTDEASDFAFIIQPSGPPNISGNFKLLFEGLTTAAIAWDATGADVVAALEAVAGAGNFVTNDGGTVINDNPLIMVAGMYAGVAGLNCAVTDDTTDNGVSVDQDQPGGPPSPADPFDGMICFSDGPQVWIYNAVNPEWILLKGLV